MYGRKLRSTPQESWKLSTKSSCLIIFQFPAHKWRKYPPASSFSSSHDFSHISLLLRRILSDKEVKRASYPSCRYSESYELILLITVAVMKVASWSVQSCSLVEANRRFRCVYCLHHHRPDDGGITHLWNVDSLPQEYTARHPKKSSSWNLTFFTRLIKYLQAYNFSDLRSRCFYLAI
jgi:hypothetical protein